MRWPGSVCAGLWRGRVDPVWGGVVGIMPCSAAAASNHRKVSSSHSCRYAPPPAPAQILHLHKTQEFYTAQRHKHTHWPHTARGLHCAHGNQVFFGDITCIYGEKRGNMMECWDQSADSPQLSSSYLSRGSTQVVFCELWSMK